MQGKIATALVGAACFALGGCLTLPEQAVEGSAQNQEYQPAGRLADPAVAAWRSVNLGLAAARQFEFPAPPPPANPPPPAPALAPLGPTGPGEPPTLYCDATPSITQSNVCGTNVTSTAHVQWTGCSAGGPTGGAAMQTSGTIDMALAIEATCGAVTDVTFTRKTVFSITLAGGAQANTFAGTVTATGTQPLFTPSWERDYTFFTTAATSASAPKQGLSGTLHVWFQGGPGTKPTETLAGTLQSGSGSLAFQNVVRADPQSCKWPTAGQIVRTDAGATHTLSFGASCGQATLDGESVSLDPQVQQPQQQQQQPPPQ